MKHILLSLPVVGLLVCGNLRAQADSIANTKHNLGSDGPGPYISSNEGRICIFCHTPHRSNSAAPLWNREDSQETYVLYDSSTFGGVPTQPSGASKLCLSCHDGSIALGRVVTTDQPITMQTGKEFLSAGKSALGTMLDNDHPISFHYNSSKGGSGVEYLGDTQIHPPVNLDDNGQVQCTSCHDVHNNQFGNFLLASNRNSAICLSCHQPTDWLLSPHSTITATWYGQGADPWADDPYTTVADNACGNCHEPHGAGHPQRLLGKAKEENNCLGCHTGHVAAKDIGQDVLRVSAHYPMGTLNVHDPTEDPLVMARHAECEDCHNPHAARAGSVAAPGVSGPLMGIDGISSTGQKVDPITYGYELCYKCHADNNGGVSYQPRQIEQTNVRLEFDTSNPSFHPVEGPGASNDVPSLLPPYTTASVIACTDCHQSSSSPDAGGNGAAGPHGSNISPLLIAEYRTDEYVQESPSAYALCYRCHSRSSLLSDQSFKEHDKHISGEDAPCAACHDAHGISATQGNTLHNTHLINLNSSYVIPNRRGQLEFVDEGNRKGNCSLKCHGEDHRQENY
jgi:predicted CXXCH cytochrome family protein